jgi:capsular polysaccharide biosynthesis protein
MAQDTPPLDSQVTQAREHQLRFIVNVLTFRWRMIAAFTVLAMLVYGAVGVLRHETIRPRFKAQAKVLVTQSFWDRDILKGTSGTPLTPFDAQSLVKRTSLQRLSEKIARTLVQQDILEGRVLSTIATDAEYAAQAAEIQNDLTLTPGDPQSGVITIEVTNWPSKDGAMRIADLAARVFVEEHHQLQLEDDRNTHEAVKKRLQELQQELYKAEAAEWDFKQAMGFQTYTNVGEEMSKIHQELTDKKATKEETQTELAKIESELKANAAQLPEALGNVTDTVVNQMLNELDTLLQEQLTMSIVYTPEYPALKEIEDEIAEKKQAILEAIKKVDEGVGDGTNVWKQRQNLYRQQLDLRLSLTGVGVRMAALQRMLEDLIPKLPELANKNMEYDRLAKDAAHIREQFNKLREREFDIRTALSRESGQVERRESVIASALPIRGVGGVWINFVIGGLVGFVVGFGLAVMLEIMDTSIRSIDDVVNYIGLDVLGTIPKMRFGKPRGTRYSKA